MRLAIRQQGSDRLSGRETRSRKKGPPSRRPSPANHIEIVRCNTVYVLEQSNLKLSQPVRAELLANGSATGLVRSIPAGEVIFVLSGPQSDGHRLVSWSGRTWLVSESHLMKDGVPISQDRPSRLKA